MADSNGDFADLEALLDQALASKPKKPPGKKEKAPALPPSWHDPLTWIAGPAIALIHKETQTLLGNFRSFTHPRLHNARQLRRITTPTPCDGIEEVSGEWWLTGAQEQLLYHSERWVTYKDLIVGITLKEMEVHCPEALVRVQLYSGAFDRVELLSDTRFTCPSRNTFLWLPKGLDVLQAMDFESKLALRAEIQEDEETTDAQEGE